MKKYIVTVSKFLKPSPGTKEGKCIVCGWETKQGHPINLSNNFTAWNLLQSGNCICEYCESLIKNQDYRLHSWVATQEGVVFVKRDELLELLCNPPSPPFSIYISKSGKKQGFLLLINRVNYSREKYCIAFDDSLVHVDLKTVREMAQIAKTARLQGFAKKDLLSVPRSFQWRERELCEKIEKYLGNPLWEVVVYAV